MDIQQGSAEQLSQSLNEPQSFHSEKISSDFKRSNGKYYIIDLIWYFTHRPHKQA